MNRNLSIERIYSLGDYKNIKFTDNIVLDTDDEQLVQKVSYMQLLTIESGFQNYMILVKKVNDLSDREEAINYLSEELIKTVKEIKQLLEKKGN